MMVTDMARLKQSPLVTTMDIRLLGGAPALDFVNTVDPLTGPDAVDGVDSPALLSAWGVHAGITEHPVAVTRRGSRAGARPCARR